MTITDTSIPQALVDIRQKGALAVCALLWGIVVQIALIGLVLGIPCTYVTITAAILAGVVTLEYRRNPTGQSVQLSSAAALAVGIGLVVYQYSDHPWQVDSHMQFSLASQFWRSTAIGA
ncbi:hypothetical protein [Roseinatronobacter sp. NSM]|uniref:hypothetical protein n=1 Tax=Roseinatronobacter sp. NSM TaxID=3457785 RepID=UPI004036074E